MIRKKALRHTPQYDTMAPWCVSAQPSEQGSYLETGFQRFAGPDKSLKSSIRRVFRVFAEMSLIPIFTYFLQTPPGYERNRKR